MPDHAWVTDITYIPTGEGWLYLAVILDLCSRFAVGWEHLTTATTMYREMGMTYWLEKEEMETKALGEVSVNERS